jgi:hypothetical protein
MFLCFISSLYCAFIVPCAVLLNLYISLARIILACERRSRFRVLSETLPFKDQDKHFSTELSKYRLQADAAECS